MTGSYHALAAEFFERGIGVGEHIAIVIIGIVDVDDVYPVKPQPLEALL